MLMCSLSVLVTSAQHTNCTFTHPTYTLLTAHCTHGLSVNAAVIIGSSGDTAEKDRETLDPAASGTAARNKR